MIIIDNDDWELPQIGKTPQIEYEYDYITKTTISGQKYRIYLGRRFIAKISYAFLNEEYIEKLTSYLSKNVDVEIATPVDTFEGEAQVIISRMPSRFDKNKWTSWEIEIVGVNRIS